MGQRLLSIHAGLVVWLLQEPECLKSSRHRVIRDSIPADAKILGVSMSPHRQHEIDIVLESDQWDNAPPRTRIEPIVEVVTE